MAFDMNPIEDSRDEHDECRFEIERLTAENRRLQEELKLWKPMTPEEAEAALDAAEAVPISKEQIDSIIARVTDPTYRPTEPEHVLMAARIRQLEKQQSDDAEPVTSGWLVGCGFNVGGGACWIRGDGPQICIRYYEDLTGGHFVRESLDGPPVLIVGGDGVKWSGTRGEVRRLCAALGVDLKSQVQLSVE